MCWILLVLLLVVCPLRGQTIISAADIDTTWVLRYKSGKVIQKVSDQRMALVNYSEDSTEADVWVEMVTRDSTGALVRHKGKVRIYGVRLADIEFRFTTSDTIPGDYGKVPYILNAEGFKKK